MSCRILFCATHLTFAALVFGCTARPSVKETQPKAVDVSSVEQAVPTFRYTTTVSQSDRAGVIMEIESELANNESEVRQLVAAKGTADALRSSMSPQQRLADLQQSQDLEQKYVQARDLYVKDIVRAKSLLALLEVSQERIDQLAEEIRDRYHEKYAAKYELSYVNELLAGKVHGFAQMLAYRISDDAIKGRQSRFATDHIIESAKTVKNAAIDQVVAELFTATKPK